MQDTNKKISMTRPMLYLEVGKCYELSFFQEWRNKNRRKVQIISAPTIHSKYIHSYITLAPKKTIETSSDFHLFWINDCCHVWDFGYSGEESIVWAGDYSIIHARLLKGNELQNFLFKLTMGKQGENK